MPTWSDVTSFIGAAAPVVGGLLGGPAGAAVGSLISKTLGVEEKPDAVIDALKNNPDALVKIKELENSKAIADMQSQLENKKVDYSHDEAYLSDRQDARKTEVEVVKSTGHIDWNKTGLAWITVLGVFVIFAVLLHTTLDKNSGAYEMLYMGFGALLTRMGTIYDYFFGSSHGSEVKTDLLSKKD
jgi:hypothetical protein